ncbi:hypothetical protein [Sansalvadorimonas verongulae]|uniref:hypothetical protein n=1 Tax=Sansalvadorimonas verongulae TaxID=2172824 RepID=UPI0012BBBE9D|nr:hypothetical protein [Sansalvadorimonas verongulae]MTI13761.1 hypothetical protein [Sansalvadorimonas verongulae]
MQNLQGVQSYLTGLNRFYEFSGQVTQYFSEWRNWGVTHIGDEVLGYLGQARDDFEKQYGSTAVKAVYAAGGVALAYWTISPLMTAVRRSCQLSRMNAEAHKNLSPMVRGKNLYALHDLRKEMKDSYSASCSRTYFADMFALGVVVMSAPPFYAYLGAAVMGVRALGMAVNCLSACSQMSKVNRLSYAFSAGASSQLHSGQAAEEMYWRVNRNTVCDASGAEFHINAVDPRHIVD